MSNYQDRNYFYHDKPCINGEPSSNNRYIYTAYAKYLAPMPETNHLMLQRISANNSIISLSPLKVNRLPNKYMPPMSKDEIIGLISLGLIEAEYLKKSYWNFCNFPEYAPEKMTVSKAIKAAKILWKIRKEHRNYFWANDLKETYILAFYLFPWDQYYVNKFSKSKVSLVQTIFFYLNVIFVLTFGNKSVKMLLLLQCQDMNHWLLKLINKKKFVDNYFEDGHPFRENL